MTRRSPAENIYQARRAAQLSRLTNPGMPDSDAEALVAAWEAEAAARGRDRLGAGFWAGASEWIDARRGRRR
jgi:hypothetical protein